VHHVKAVAISSLVILKDPFVFVLLFPNEMGKHNYKRATHLYKNPKAEI